MGRGRQHLAEPDSDGDLRGERQTRNLQRADQPLQRVVHAGADVRAAEARLCNQSARHHRHLGRLTAAWRPAATPPVAIVCRMAADLVPICLSLTDGDHSTVWAPRWRDAGDEWEGFLGKDEDLYAFQTAADLVAFVRTNTDNDLVDHPGWKGLTEANAHKLEPADDKQFDLIGVEEVVSEKPTEKSVTALANSLAIVSSIGSVCELPAVMKFFNGNPTLGTLAGGIDHFTGKAGLKRWNVIAEVIGRSWDVVLGADEDFWLKVGIDPIRIMTAAGTFYTLRCYFDDRPIFLGRNGRISVFTSERALARYLADEHDHDLSDLSTYDDIRTAATDGSLQVEVTEDNVYVLTGMADDLADGPDALDRDQLDLAVELLRDVGDYAEDNTVEKALARERPLGKLAAYVLDPDSVSKPAPPYAASVRAWEELEQFVESRLRRE